LRKPPWYWKDKRVKQGEQIKTFHKNRRAVQRTLRRMGPAHQRPQDHEIQYAMQCAQLEAVAEGLPRPNFHFSVSEVIAVWRKKQGQPGIWFELADGRLYDKYGEPDTTDPDDYEA
jgi:hypothetical protein